MRVRNELEIRAGDRRILARRSHAWGRLVRRHYQHPRGATEKHVFPAPAQLYRRYRKPSRQQLRAVAMPLYHVYEFPAEAIHRLAVRHARERKRTGIAPGGRIAQDPEHTVKHGAVNVLRLEVPYGAARHHPVRHGIRARQRQAFRRHRIFGAFPVKRNRTCRAYRQTVLATHAPLGRRKSRQAVIPRAQRAKRAVAHTCATPDAPGTVNLKQVCHTPIENVTIPHSRLRAQAQKPARLSRGASPSAR